MLIRLEGVEDAKKRTVTAVHFFFLTGFFSMAVLALPCGFAVWGAGFVEEDAIAAASDILVPAAIFSLFSRLIRFRLATVRP